MAQTTNEKLQAIGGPGGRAGHLSHTDKIKSLTLRQREVYDLLVNYARTHGYPPSCLELAELIGVSSPNAAAEHIRALHRKGVITVARGVSRGITINEPPAANTAELLLRELVDEVPGARQRAIDYLALAGVPL
jgi:repressor LexA